MKQIVHHEQCRRCRECCRFRANREDFAPIFTDQEVEAIRAVRQPMPEFTPFRSTTNIRQIRLKQAVHDDPVYPFVCPFLDEDNYQCTIYDLRPFDCRIWPFIIVKVRATGAIQLEHFTGDACLALQEVSPEDFAEYEAYMQELVAGADMLALLRDYPGLIWENDNEGRYTTIPSREITALLKRSSGA